MARIVDILVKRFPNTDWTITNDDYSTLVWYDTNIVPKPTEEEIRVHSSDVDTEMKWDVVREERNRLLVESDWTQLVNTPLTSEKQEEWNQYRIGLRNIPQQTENPDNVVWPTKPV